MTDSFVRGGGKEEAEGKEEGICQILNLFAVIWGEKRRRGEDVTWGTEMQKGNGIAKGDGIYCSGRKHKEYHTRSSCYGTKKCR